MRRQQSKLHCVVLHSKSTFLSGISRDNDYDHECYTRANVAHSRATDLTISACPVNVQGTTGMSSILCSTESAQCMQMTSRHERPSFRRIPHQMEVFRGSGAFPGRMSSHTERRTASPTRRRPVSMEVEEYTGRHHQTQQRVLLQRYRYRTAPALPQRGERFKIISTHLRCLRVQRVDRD